MASYDNPIATLTEYELHHLAAHLATAGRDEDLHRLLTLETVQGRNAWYEAKEAVGDTQGYLIDVTLAWQLADAQALKDSKGVGLVNRYALIVTSLNSLAMKISPSLLVALVEMGLWNSTQGLTYTRRIPDLLQRVRMLARLVPCLAEVERVQALQDVLRKAQEILAKREQELIRPLVSVLIELAPHLLEVEQVQVLQKALTAVQEIDFDDRERAIRLAELAPHLPEPLLREALATAREIANGKARMDALIGLVSHLPEIDRPEVLQEILTAVGKLVYEEDQNYALKKLVAHLPEPLLGEVLAAARAIANKRARLHVLIGLVSHLPEINRPEVLQEILTTAGEFEKKVDQEFFLRKLAFDLPEPLLREALKIAREIWFEPFRGHILGELALGLAALGYPKEALTVVREIGDEGTQIHAMEILRPYLSRVESTAAQHEILTGRGQTDSYLEMKETGLSIRSRLKMLLMTENREITNALAQVEIVEKFVSDLPEPLVREALTQARQDWLLEPFMRQAQQHARQHRSNLLSGQDDLVFAQEHNRMKEKQSVTLMGLAPRLAELGYPEEALVVAREIADEKLRARALVRQMRYWPEGQAIQILSEALATTQKIVSEPEWLHMLTKLTAHLPKSLLQEALAAAREITNKEEQVEVLVNLAGHLPEIEASQVLYEALAVIEIADKKPQLKALVSLVSYLPEIERNQALREVVRAAREAGDKRGAVEALAEQLPYQTEIDRHQTQQEFLTAVQDGVLELLELVHHLAKVGCPEVALAVVREGSVGPVELAPCLSELGYSEEALAVARKITDKELRMKMLTELVSHLPEFERTQILRQALVTARAIVDEGERVEALVGLVPHLKEVDRIQVLKEALMAAWASEKQTQWLEDKREVLAKLVSRLPESLLREVIKAAQGVEDKESRADILWDLGLLLAELGHIEALDATRDITDKKYRNHILTKLLRRLAERSYSAEVWAVLVPRLATLGYPDESLKMTRRIKLAALRTAVLRRRDSRLAKLPYANLASLWSERLHDLAQHPRTSLLLELGELAPTITALGGSAAISETFRAIQDVSCWWP